MGNPYHYLFYYTQYNVSKIRSYNSREAAILYISAIVFFCTMPFIAKATALLIDKNLKVLFYAVILGYGFLVYYMNKRYFENRRLYTQLKSVYEEKSKTDIMVGRTIAWVSFVASFILFFLILREL